MAYTTRIKNGINTLLNPLNLQIRTLTADRLEAGRLGQLLSNGHFDEAAFPLLLQFSQCDPRWIIDAVREYWTDLKRFGESDRDGYTFANDFFCSPDAEVAYALTRALRPKRIIEIGSGNSTHLFREAILDSRLRSELISIDPLPRKSIDGVADQVIREAVERLPVRLFEGLEAGDILFVDSSHRIGAGTDAVHLIANVLPRVRRGVFIHFHDIFLPFEYPKDWVVREQRGWGEQYVIHALLQGSREYEVLWPGHYLQRSWPNFADFFEHRQFGTAASLWLRKETYEEA